MHDDTTNFDSVAAQSDFSDVSQLHMDNKAERPYVFLELCAGSASLSATVRSLGVEVMAFDHESNRHQTKCKVISLDLSLPHAYDRLIELVNTCRILGVHMGPPCGTCSKARGIPMADGTAGPQPLRSARHLLGIPGLRHRDKIRVDAANTLYEQLGMLVEELERLQIPWKKSKTPRTVICGIFHILPLPWPMEPSMTATLAHMAVQERS